MRISILEALIILALGVAIGGLLAPVMDVKLMTGLAVGTAAILFIISIRSPK